MMYDLNNRQNLFSSCNFKLVFFFFVYLLTVALYFIPKFIPLTGQSFFKGKTVSCAGECP